MVNNQTSTHDISIWGISLPIDALKPADIKYLGQIACLERPPVEWLWQEMDRAWDSLGLDNCVALQGQAIDNFYAHPIWVVNGVFSAVDPISVQHRNSIAALINGLNAKRIADYGGGFGELALKLAALSPKIQIDIVEPYPSKLGILRVAGKDGIKFVDALSGQYDCILVQDVLEHAEHPLALTTEMVKATKLNGHLIFANCFYPVIKCHLPSTFYLRHTFSWVVRGLGLKFENRAKKANHALIFKKVGNINIYMFMLLKVIAKLLGSLLNIVNPLFSSIRLKMRR